MNAHVNPANLIQAAKELSSQWERTKSFWRDAKSREFEEKYLAELPQDVARAAAAMEEIGTLLRKVKMDCE